MPLKKIFLEHLYYIM